MMTVSHKSCAVPADFMQRSCITGSFSHSGAETLCASRFPTLAPLMGNKENRGIKSAYEI